MNLLAFKVENEFVSMVNMIIYESTICLSIHHTPGAISVLAQVSRTLNHEILLEGSLQKTDSSAKKAFKRRWCILYGKRLMYFNNELVSCVFDMPEVLFLVCRTKV